MSDCDLILQAQKLLEDQTLSNGKSQSTICFVNRSKEKTARKTKAFVSLIVLSLVLLFFLDGSANVSAKREMNTGPIIELYWDNNCTEKISEIDWGIVEPGSSESVVVYIKNTAGSEVILKMDTGDPNPQDALKYLFLEWNYSGERLKNNEILEVTLTLSVSNDAKDLTGFNFRINIEGREIHGNTNRNNEGKGKNK